MKKTSNNTLLIEELYSDEKQSMHIYSNLSSNIGYTKWILKTELKSSSQRNRNNCSKKSQISGDYADWKIPNCFIIGSYIKFYKQKTEPFSKTVFVQTYLLKLTHTEAK